MSWSMVIALLLAFVFDFDPPQSSESGSSVTVMSALTPVAACLGMVWMLATVASEVLSLRVAWRGRASSRLRLSLVLCDRAVDLVVLAAYSWLIVGLDWRGTVAGPMRLGNAVLVDDLVILLPFLLGQIISWWCLYPAEVAVRGRHPRRPYLDNLGAYLVFRARQGYGMVLPAALIFGFSQELLRITAPTWAGSVWGLVFRFVVSGTFVAVALPAFVRLRWPSHPLPPSPLRDRLLAVAQRLRFRCTEILVWDTGGVVVNAGIAGIVPWYRYVLLTDALVEHLDDHEIEAIFGHEIGHIANRDAAVFGAFLVGSLGLFALMAWGIDQSVRVSLSAQLGLEPGLSWGLAQALVLLAICLYLFLVYGYLSRCFERQADLYACRAVSCDRPTCPPHRDVNDTDGSTLAPVAPELCSVGIQIYIVALMNVVGVNDINPTSWSWRHGSIDQRIRFLERIRERPHEERSFRGRVRRLLAALALVLMTSSVLALTTGAFEMIR